MTRVRSTRGPARQRGQATVEFALVLPLVLLAALFVVQVAVVCFDQVLVLHAARAAGRVAAVDPSMSATRRAASETPGLEAGRLVVTRGTRGPPGSQVTVVVRYRAPTSVPIVGSLVGDVELSATTVFRVE